MSKPTYRPLFNKAAKLLWQEKRLWFLGIFAGLINTGAVLEVGFRVFKPVDTGTSLTNLFLTNTIPGLDSLSLFFSQFALLSPVRTVLTIIVISLSFLILVVLAVMCQQGLFKGSLSRGKLGFKKLLKTSPKIFFQILLIDLAAKILVGVTLALSSIPLAIFQNSTIENTIASFVVLIVLIIIILTISLLSILAIASIVRGKHSLTEAIEESWAVFRKHPLVCFETALLLFLVGIVAAIITFLTWIVIGAPYSLAFSVELVTDTPYLSSIVSFGIGLVGTVITILIGGLFTAYQYIVWTLVYEELRTKGLKPKLHRFLKTFRLI